MITKYRPNNNNSNLQIISDSHRSYDPMMYPTFFPSGLDGWHLELRNARGNRIISCIQFYSHRIMKRMGTSNILHKGNKLF